MRYILQIILLMGIAACLGAFFPVHAQLFEGVPTATPTPFLGANWKPTWKVERKGYELYFYWTAVDKAQGYSVAVSKKAGAAPRKEVKTTQTSYTFKSVSSGQWYVNLIAKKKDGTWTEPAFWTVTLQDPTATNEAEATPSGLLTVTPSPDPDVLSVKTKVADIIKSLTGTPAVSRPASGFACDCTKTCKTVNSCKEAFFLLGCGCTNLDANGDGTPCDNKCGNSE